MAQIELFYLAHSRTGDKGNSQTMSLIPYRTERLRAARAAGHRRGGARAVRQACARQGHALRAARISSAFNFVLEETLQGGVNDSLNLDTHGKSRSAVLLAMMVEVPDEHPAFAARAALIILEEFLNEFLAFSAHGAWSGPVSRRLPRRPRSRCLRQVWLAERDAWRHEAEVACLKSGLVKEGPSLVAHPADLRSRHLRRGFSLEGRGDRRRRGDRLCR